MFDENSILTASRKAFSDTEKSLLILSLFLCNLAGTVSLIAGDIRSVAFEEVASASNPSITITAPNEGDTFLSGLPSPIIIKALIEGELPGLDRVEFLANGEVIGEDDSQIPSYAFGWNGAPTGEYDLQVVARNALGGTLASSDIVSITVEERLVFQQPQSGSFHPDNDGIELWAWFYGDNSVIDHVEFRSTTHGLIGVASNSLSPNFYQSWFAQTPGSEKLEPGVYSLQAIALAEDGSTLFESELHTVTVLPTPVIQWPPAGHALALEAISGWVDISIGFSSVADVETVGGGIAKLEAWSSELLGEAVQPEKLTSGNYLIRWNKEKMSLGDHGMTVVCHFNNGTSTTSKTVPITIFDRPVPLWTSPGFGTIFLGGQQINLAATIETVPGLVGVEFRTDLQGNPGFVIAAFDSPPYTHQWSSPEPNRILKLDAVAIYEDGLQLPGFQNRILSISSGEEGFNPYTCFFLVASLFDAGGGGKPLNQFPEDRRGVNAASVPATGIDLEPFRRFRDEILSETAQGTYYAELYKEASPGLIRALAVNPDLVRPVVNALIEWTPAIRAFVEGDGEVSVEISPGMTAAARSVLSGLREAASDDLVEILDAESAVLDPETWTGLTLGDVLERAESRRIPAEATRVTIASTASEVTLRWWAEPDTRHRVLISVDDLDSFEPASDWMPGQGDYLAHDIAIETEAASYYRLEIMDTPNE